MCPIHFYLACLLGNSTDLTANRAELDLIGAGAIYDKEKLV